MVALHSMDDIERLRMEYPQQYRCGLRAARSSKASHFDYPSNYKYWDDRGKAAWRLGFAEGWMYDGPWP
jgi:hypothetical protein